MNNPTVTIDGKTYTAPEPKAKLWREIMTIQKSLKNIKDEDLYQTIIKTIVSAFRHPEITTETAEEIDANCLFPLFEGIIKWVNDRVHNYAEKLPNAETPEMGE
jgi:hypothetical protein